MTKGLQRLQAVRQPYGCRSYCELAYVDMDKARFNVLTMSFRTIILPHRAIC